MCANYKVSKFANQIYEGLTKTKHVAKIIACIHTDLSKSSAASDMAFKFI